MQLVLALALFAQMFYPVRGYTTADPISADLLGLATTNGRYQIELVGGDLETCSMVQVGQNVDFWGPDNSEPPLFSLTPIDQDDGLHSCAFRILQRMDETPCFVSLDGVCDVAAETDSQ